MWESPFEQVEFVILLCQRLTKGCQSMKHIYLIGGTMGIGKTSACLALKNNLCRSVFLDGDWCWSMNPFVVTEETKHMVMENICFLLNNFIRCSAYDHHLLLGVMHEQGIAKDILSRLQLDGCKAHVLSLVCDAETLERRISGDIAAGLRTPNDLTRSLGRLPLYELLSTGKLDVSQLTPEETAQQILALCKDS